jgi:hypothetical protein
MSALSSRPLRALMIALPVLTGAFALVTALRDIRLRGAELEALKAASLDLQGWL